MANNISAKLADGTEVEFTGVPDDVTPEQVKARIAKKYPGVAIEKISRLPMSQAAPAVKTDPQIDLAAAMKKQYDDTSGLEALAVGTGRGFVDVGQGVQQLGTYLGEKIGGAIHGPLAPEYGSSTPALDEMRTEQAAEEALYQRSTPSGVAAGIGRLIGNLAGPAVPVSGLVRGAGAGASAGRLAATGAAEGAIGGAVQPVLTAPSGDDFLSEKGQQVGLGALLGGGIPLAVRGVSGAVNRVMGSPSYMTNAFVDAAEGNAPILSRVKSLANPEFARESKQIADEIGSTIGEQFHMTPAQRSGSKFAQAAENSARQNALLADKVRAVDKKIGEQLNTYIDKVMGKISAAPQNAETAGRAVQTAMRKGVDDLIEARNTQAAKDYGAIREQFGNDATKVKYDNVTAELEGLLQEYDGIIGADAESVVSQVKKMLNDLSAPDATGTMRLGKADAVDKAMKNRSELSAAAAGSGDIFKDLSKSKKKVVAARLLNAIENDFDNVANEAGDTPLGELLRNANSNYRKGSEAIESTKNLVFKKMLGDELIGADGAIKELSPEAVMDRVRKMKPTEARSAIAFMRKADPENTANVKRFLIEDALEKTKEVAPSAGADPVQNFNQFVKAMENPAIKEWFEPEEFAKIKTAVSAMRRLGDSFGKNPSGTQVQGVLYHLMDHPIKGPLDAIKLFIGMGGIAKGMESGARYAPVWQEGMRKASGAVGKTAGRAAVPSVREE